LKCSFPSAVGQLVPSASTGSSSASVRPPRCHSRSTRTCCAMPVGSSSPTMVTTRAPCSTISGTRTSSTRCATPKWRRTGSRIFGANRRRQARDDFRSPLNHLGIRRSIALGNKLLEDLECALELLVGHGFDPAGMLQLHLPRHQHSADLQIRSRRLAPNPLEHLSPMLLPVLRQIEQKALVERSACSLR